MVSILPLSIASRTLAQPEIISASMCIYNGIQGSGKGTLNENLSYFFEVYFDVTGDFNDLQPEAVLVNANTTSLPIIYVQKFQGTNDDVLSLLALGVYEDIPVLLGRYSITIKDKNALQSEPYVIGELEDYPKDAPDFLYPKHGQSIKDRQPTFQWETFQSIYLGDYVNPNGHEFNLDFPDGSHYFGGSYPGDQTSVEFNHPNWDPSQPPSLSPGTYKAGITSFHQVTPNISFAQGRSIQFVFAEPRISSSTSLTLGDVYIGTSARQKLEVGNTGTDTLKVTDITLSGNHVEEFSMAPSSFILKPDQIQEIVLTFTPVAMGEKSLTLTILSNDPETWGGELYLKRLHLIDPVFVPI